MYVTVAVEDDLLARIVNLTQISNQREAIETALLVFIAKYSQHTQPNILELVGQPLIDPNYDVRAVRQEMEHGIS